MGDNQSRCENNLGDYIICNRSQTASDCGKNKKVANKPLDECAIDVLALFWCQDQSCKLIILAHLIATEELAG